jgi:UDP-N-acetylmuramate--alanine ligase
VKQHLLNKTNLKRKQVYFMYQINFHSPISIYFIGIGGISMSGLAEILQKECFSISGSDEKESALTKHLENWASLSFINTLQKISPINQI